MAKIKLGILGIDGAMGKLITNLAIQDELVDVSCGFTIPESPNIGMDIGQLVGKPNQDVKVSSIVDLDNILKNERPKPDIMIDFTIADATEQNAPKVLGYNIPMVIGTTGLSKDFHENISKLASQKNISLVISTNMAVGVNVLFMIAKELASKLKDWEIEIIEAHHHRKKDAPSGTAMTLAQNIAEALGVDLDKVAKYGRQKGPNPRKWGNQEIGIHSIRAGDIVGDHIILYAGNGERIELKHQAHSRECFASGAIKAAKFLYEHKDEGKIFNMQDVLGLN
ncbi:MAG: 4-hydroxy-tetrahydrodipicolinate reductase [Promethearchaeota archaeon]